MNSLRYALRTLAKSPASTAVILLTLALGIGANTAIFTVVNGVLLRPLPYPDSDRLAYLWETYPPDGWGTVSQPNLRDWQQRNSVFEHLVGFSDFFSSNLQDVAQPERLSTVFSTGELFATLRAHAALGRTLAAADDNPSSPAVVVLSNSLWRTRFNSDLELIGKTIRLDGQSITVVGVMPPDFEFPPDSNIALWRPFRFSEHWQLNRGEHWLRVIGRLKPAVTIEAASAQMNAIARQLAKEYPAEQEGRGVRIRTYKDALVSWIRPALLMLLGAVGFVLLIACANVANLLLARTATRRREIAVRMALGAGRMQVIGQSLLESLVLSLLGGVFGLLIAAWGLKALLALAETQLRRPSAIHFDARVYIFLLLICAISAVLFGLSPALQASSGDVQKGLREGDERSGSAGRQTRLRQFLVIGEFALSLMLLVGAGLLIKSFLLLTGTDTGMAVQNVLTAHVSLPTTKYSTPAAIMHFFNTVQERAEALPGVRAAAWVSIVPLQNWGSNGNFQIRGRAPLPVAKQPFAEMRTATRGYFQVFAIPIIEGRDFTPADYNDKSPNVVIVNQALVRRYFPGEDPLGKQIGDASSWFTIVGVSRDVHYETLDRPVSPEIVYCFPQVLSFGCCDMALAVNAIVPPASLTSSITNVVRSVDRQQPLYDVATMQTIVADSLSNQRLYSLLLGIFASVALALAAAGIYAVMSYLVTQRTQEIGVRMALGARINDVLRLVIGEGMRLVAAGIVIGLIGAFALSGLLKNFIFGISDTDLTTYLAVMVFLSAIALLANYVPARRAAKVHPMSALRYE